MKIFIIIHISLDLEEFSLAQPDEYGRCTKDSFMVRTTVGERLPMLCGDNKGQHLYVDMGRGSANPVVLSVITNELENVSRKWKIRISFIKCDNYVMAPSGCLQYYRSPSDVIRSFNYGPKVFCLILLDFNQIIYINYISRLMVDPDIWLIYDIQPVFVSRKISVLLNGQPKHRNHFHGVFPMIRCIRHRQTLVHMD